MAFTLSLVKLLLYLDSRIIAVQHQRDRRVPLLGNIYPNSCSVRKGQSVAVDGRSCRFWKPPEPRSGKACCSWTSIPCL